MNQNFEEKPVTILDWLLTMLIMTIPLINLIMLIVWAFDSGTNPSKSNWAKASLIWMLISVVLMILLFSFFIGLAGGLGQYFENFR
jgi:heme/copper-type cytochrome/quinol oxidase subunit 2